LILSLDAMNYQHSSMNPMTPSGNPRFDYECRARSRRKGAALVAATALLIPSASAATRFVAEGATGAGNGSSWTDAFPKLQDALAAAVAGDEIWVAAGVYYPDERAGQPDGTASSVFSLKASVPLFGGFAGNETLRAERNPVANVTVLSGDIGQNDTNLDGNRIAESSTDTVATNSTTVVRFNTSTGTTRLDGFTVTAGSGTSTGGGLSVSRSGLTVANCWFVGNKATNGGGIHVSFGSAVFTRCKFSGNSATSGAAAYLASAGTLFTHCVMSGNSATQYGGAVYASDGVQAVNCLFLGNVAATYGGAWYQNGAFSSPNIAQCTMTGNSASQGGAFYSASGQVALRNSILWGNTATSTSTALASSIAGLALPTVSRCDIAGSGGSSTWNSQAGTNLGGNIDANPQFLGAAPPANPKLAFRPLAGSPVVDAGLAANLPVDSTDLDDDGNLSEAIPIDLAEASRSVGAAPDMGVFETGHGPAIIATAPVLRFSPNSGLHPAALDLSDIFDSTAQSFASVATTPSTIATATVDSPSGEVSITPLSNATGVATLVVSATNASGQSNYIVVRVEVFPAAFLVDAGATGAATGLTWTDAFPTLQDALARGGSAHEIWVAEGAYFPDQGGGATPGSTTARFVIPPGITLRGGFAGTEASASEADPIAHPTILSGDIGHDDVNTDGNKIAETTANRVGTNTSILLTLTGAPAGTGIDGVILTAAGSGGALKITGGNPFVRRCHFSGNSGTNGGAALVDSSASVIFSTCGFSGNLASTSGGALRGTSATLAFENCSFTGNTANGTGGGGALNFSSSVGSLRSCTFSQNICPGVFGDGGAVRGISTSLQAVGCSFRGNEGYDGGALHLSGAAAVSLTNCLAQENRARSDGGGAYIDGIDAVLTGCSFAANRSTDDGGALYHYAASPSLDLCTLAGNSAGKSGGAIYNRTANTSDPAAPALRNSILWNNQAGYSGTPAWASVSDVSSDHPTTFSHCIIARSGGSSSWNPELGIDLGFNLDVDPRLVMAPVPGLAAPQSIDLRLQAGSPAIDAGSNPAVPADPSDVDGDSNTAETLPLDVSGKPRIAGARVDLGAHEAEPGPSWLAATPRLRFDTLSGFHGNVLDASALFGPTAVEFAIEAQSPSSVISTQVGAATGILDIAVLPEVFGTTLVVVRATDGSGRSSYQTVTVDVYPPIVFVNASATGSANGLSWQNALPTLQAALQFPRIANLPLEIWVAQGVYHPDEGPGQIADDVASTFRISPNCGVYGGFAGNETQRNARNPLVHPTILSGDLAQDDLNADGNSIAESVDAIVGTNAARVVCADACLAGDRMDGLLITAADGGSSGGGLSCTGGAFSVVDCRFQGNRGIWGGGVSFKNASTTLTNCLFTANRADARGKSFSSDGGAAYFLNSQVTLTDCRFVANQAADSDGGIGEGGALIVYGGAFTAITGCDFENTVAGGAVSVEDTSLVISNSRIKNTLSGGGLSCSNTAATLVRCVISGNIGGGLDFGGHTVPLTCVDTVISGNSKSGDGGGAAIWGHQPVRFTNCLIAGNSCWNFGGGIDSWASDSLFTNCTFSANRSNFRGGAFYSESGSSQRFVNCILWENQTAGSTTSSFATLIGSPYETPPAHFQNCIVANSGGSTAWNSLSGYDDGGNLDADPRFLVRLSPAAAPSTSGDFQIGCQSPALEGGDNVLVSATTDLAGAPRITNGIVDIGAYEGQNDQFDLDGDGLSDAFELAFTLPPSRTSLTPNADPDGDGRPTLLEFALGSNPMAPEEDSATKSSILNIEGTRYLSLNYRRNRWAAQFLEIKVEQSLDLDAAHPWSVDKTTVESVTPIGADVDEVTERSLSPVSSQTREFLRLNAHPIQP
jgi:predicted outer membrane repeat protein